MGFRDPRLTVRERVADLLGQLTLTEKIGLLHQHQAPIQRLGIGAFRTGTEALHGLAWLGEATVFPQAIGLGATWDPDLVRRVGSAVGDEVRASHRKERASLNVWAPVVNPLRDPRWGRNEEGYSEDPWLTGQLGKAYAQGLRGDDPRYLKTAPTLKHFLGYNNETDRCTTSSNLSPRVLHEYEFPCYRPAIESGAAVAVMASYNLVNGTPAHVSPLINEQLRQWTDEEIFVVSDAWAPSNLATLQRFFPDHAASHAAALKAGIDSFTDHGDDAEVTIERITQALQGDLLTEADVDRAVARALTVRVRLGEFDSDGYPSSEPDIERHQALAREAAQRSIVLLKNDGGLLPLSPGIRKVAVIGPLAGQLMTDWYSGTLPYEVTIHSGLTQRFGGVAFAFAEGVDRITLRHKGGGYLGDEKGFDVFDWGGPDVIALRSVSNGRYLSCHDGELVADSPGPHGWEVHETFRLLEQADGTVSLYHELSKTVAARSLQIGLLRNGVEDAVTAAAGADAVVVVLGNHPLVNGRETEDRRDLALPKAQERLLREVHAANPSVVLMLTSSYPYAVAWADRHVPAIVWTSHGGQELGRAVADVLCGDADPAGRLPQTWYGSHTELPDLLDYDIIAGDATYLYHRGTPLYPFGHGLSFTTFDYRNLRLSHDDADPAQTVEVSVDVVNVGERPGEEVVQLYTRQLRSRVKQPLRRLRGFERVRLEPGEQRTVTLTLSITDLSFWDVTTGRMVVEAARHRVMVGRSATDIRCCASLSVRGEHIGPRRAAVIRAIDHDESSDVDLVVGDAVAATAAGAWLAFGATDLSGVTQASITLSGTPGPVFLRAGDPLDGEVLAAFDAQGEASVRPSGIVELYLVCEAAGTVIGEVRFA